MKHIVPQSKTNIFKSVKLEKFNEIALKYPFKILIAEDNFINQKLIIKVFTLLGYETDIAANGLETLDAIQRKKYDLIFMDIMMPLMNGYEATKIIIAQNALDRPLIIAMTANANDGDRERCFEVGMDDYITKPVKIEIVMNVIKLWGEKKFY